MMLGFGVAALTANAFAGRVTPGSARRWLLAGLATQIVALVLYLAGPDDVAIVALATMLINTFHTSTITLGIAAATAIGSRSYYRIGGLGATLWVGVSFTIAALALTYETPDRAARPKTDTVPAA
ncbi:hypothetical protein P9209_16960 [Prescottella defluvii]|nr:hypothetical protein P9209_16960 [Prescottella defluvii]